MKYNSLGDKMDGLILVNKARQMTSHDVVNQMRKILHTKKVGHSGTLDPNVEGVLCVFVNKGTKAIQFMEDKTKEYHGIMKFGALTSTEDSDGEILEICKVDLPLDKNRIAEIAKAFIGKNLQIPPMISSVKINGKKLYEYYREGIEIERVAREINISSFEIININGDEIEFKINCSAGTYIRTICVDFAKTYGTLGYMLSLVRTRVGKFKLEDCMTLEELRTNEINCIPVMEALSELASQEVTDPSDVINGKRIEIDSDKELVLITHNHEALAVYKKEKGNTYKSERGLW